MIDESYEAELPTSRPEPAARLTTVIQLSHETFQEAATQLSLVSSANLASKEQVYKRTFTVGPDQRPLDLGWLSDSAGCVVIENLEGTGLTTNPTEQEAEAIASRVIQLSDGWTVPPGLPFIGWISQPSSISIWCANGSARCRITVIPK